MPNARKMCLTNGEEVVDLLFWLNIKILLRITTWPDTSIHNRYVR